MGIKPSFNCGYFSPGNGQSTGPPPPGGGRREPFPFSRQRTDPGTTPGGPVIIRPGDPGGGGGGGDICSYPIYTCNRRPITITGATWFDCDVTGQNGFVRRCQCAYTENTWCSYSASSGPCNSPPVLIPPEFDDLTKCIQNCKPQKIFECDRTRPFTPEPTGGGTGPSTPTPGGPIATGGGGGGGGGPNTYSERWICNQNPGTGYETLPCPTNSPLCIEGSCKRQILTVGVCRMVIIAGDTPFPPGSYATKNACEAFCESSFGPSSCQWSFTGTTGSNGPSTPTPLGGGGGSTTPTPGAGQVNGAVSTGNGGPTTPTRLECYVYIYKCIRTITGPRRVLVGCPPNCICTTNESAECRFIERRRLSCTKNDGNCSKCFERFTPESGTFADLTQVGASTKCQQNCSITVYEDCARPTPDANTPGGLGGVDNGGGNGNNGTTPGPNASTGRGLTTAGNGGGGGGNSTNPFPPQNRISGPTQAPNNTTARRTTNRNTVGGLGEYDEPTQPQTRVYFKCVKAPPTSPETVNCFNPITRQKNCQCPVIRKATCQQEVVTSNPDGSFPPPTPPFEYFSTNSDSACANCADEIGSCPTQPIGPTTGGVRIEPPNNGGSNDGGVITLPGGNSVRTNQSAQFDNELVLTEELTQNETLALNQDFDTSLLFAEPLPFDGNVTYNDRYYLDIFADYIHKSIYYILDKTSEGSTWDTLPLSDLTYDNIEKSLNPQFLNALKNIRGLDNKTLPTFYFLDIIKSKLVTGELNSIDVHYIKKLAGQERITLAIPTKTKNEQINTLKAFAYLEQRLIPLDPNVQSGSRNSSLVPLFKTFATDLEKRIPIVASGVTNYIYINDDDTVVGRVNYKITDGDYLQIGTGVGKKRLYVSTQKDHAYVITAYDKTVALNLLGGDPFVHLSTSSSYSSLVEFTHDVDIPRNDFYFLKLDIDSVVTSKKTAYLDTTIARYTLQPTVTDADYDNINEYIKYKSNHEVYHMNYDDLFIDHMLVTSSVNLRQDDIRFDGNARKTNKTVPLLVRQVPWYIIIFPTDRHEYNTFLGKSKISTFRTGDNGVVERSIGYSIPLNRDIYDPNLDIPKFIGYNLSFPEENVFGQIDNQSRKMFLDKNNSVFKTGYRDEQPLPRKKSGLRIAYEIIQELTNNYIVDRGVTTFDVFSRMTFSQFNSFATNLDVGVYERIKSGAFGSKVYSVTKYSGDPYLFKTALKKRRIGATATDTFRQIKSTNTGYYVQPPTREDQPKLITPPNSRPLRN